jgi:CheY-like chemotaxis protein
MSHEIRTPMNAVVGLSRLMLGMPLGPKVRRYAEMIDASSRALLNIINDILDFSKIEAGKYQIHRAPCEPGMIVQEVAELLAEKAQGKGIDLIYRVAPEVPRIVEADADRVRQVLTNLVGNAVKFTDHGEVYIQVLAQPGSDGEVMLRIEVRDTGIGVSEDMREHIFESFSQADGSLVRKHGGTGLGLAISKQLVRLMGGTIAVESQLGKGSCFFFTLPVKVIDATSAVRAQPASLGKRALIACDNEHAGAAIAEHVTAWGMSAVLVKTEVEAALALTAGPRIDIVVISETQSGTQGKQLIAALRPHAKGVPVVLLSQLRADSTRNELAQEVAAQLAQPVRMSELYECLARVLLPGSLRPANNQVYANPRHFAGAHVLVVDDNEMNQFVAKEQLERLGCKVDQAFDGRQALEAVFRHEYALVFMDCQMPVMDGYTATREIRARETGARRNVIVALTAHALEGERDHVLAAGMDDYLTKPVRPQTLQRTLSRWVKGEQAAATDLADEEFSPPEREASAHAVESDEEPAKFEDCATALLQLFLEKVPSQLEQLDGALALGEIDEVRAQAHKLKGSLLTVSARQLAELAQGLQHAAEQGDLSQCDAPLAALMARFFVLEKRVKAELSDRSRKARGVSNG